jgi:restriction endonuclease Mrr
VRWRKYRSRAVPGNRFPEFEALMRPLLQFLEDGRLQPSEEIRGALADQFSVTPAMRAELLENGTPR